MAITGADTEERTAQTQTYARDLIEIVRHKLLVDIIRDIVANTELRNEDLLDVINTVGSFTHVVDTDLLDEIEKLVIEMRNDSHD